MLTVSEIIARNGCKDKPKPEFAWCWCKIYLQFFNCFKISTDKFTNKPTFNKWDEGTYSRLPKFLISFASTYHSVGEIYPFSQIIFQIFVFQAEPAAMTVLRCRIPAQVEALEEEEVEEATMPRVEGWEEEETEAQWLEEGRRGVSLQTLLIRYWACPEWVNHWEV